VSDKLEMMCQEAVVAQFKVLSQSLPGGSEKKQESQDIRSPGRDLNPGALEYEAGVSMLAFWAANLQVHTALSPEHHHR
jgi:hypothetical protein